MPQSMPFVNDNFLLDTEEARALYHNYAESMPIIDYHCHISPADIAHDTRWENITQVWLYGDHYKWRCMRTNGVPERLCTGDASDREKFDAFAATMPYLLRNPMYHWSHLELARYFGIDDRLLDADTADSIWTDTCRAFESPEMSARSLMRRSNVRLICTTDDPTDSLEHHRAIAEDPNFDIAVLPAWRPDKALAVDRPRFFNAWVEKLESASDTDIGDDFEAFLEALQARHNVFAEAGCKLSDYGIETVYADDYTGTEISAIFARVRDGDRPDDAEIVKFRSAMLYELGRMDAEADWTWQIHYNALRNNNTRMFDELGPDTGFDSIGDWPVASALSRLLDRLNVEQRLPRTILYTLNPRDNEVLASMLGNFQDSSVPGKIQFGSGWWFNDQEDGMLRHIEAVSNMSLLSRFVGMLTDSRSFLSYTRHEYFRRILCNIVGRDIATGRIPRDIDLAGRMVRDVSYNNAVRYFGFDLDPATRKDPARC